MLHVIFGECKEVIYNTSLFFKNTYESEWLEEDETKQMIFDIDKSKVLSDGAIESPVLGIIPPTNLSGGVKTLILINHISDKIFNASNCGDNCAQWLLKIAQNKDVTVNLRHLMDFGTGDFTIKIENTNKIVHNMLELITEAGSLV
ncbi:MAG: DUF4869 domain-containing protein [Treponema sp.]|nr:DUF4869 domain-containing protein [Treponema sp.]